MLTAIEFEFLSFDSGFRKLQNCIFSKLRKHYPLGHMPRHIDLGARLLSTETDMQQGIR